MSDEQNKKRQTIRKFLIISLAVFALLITGCAEKTVPPKQMGWKEAQELMAKQPNHLIIDVRSPEEYYPIHLVKAINIPLQLVEKEAPTKIENKTQPVFVYCRTGRRSKLAADALARMGYINIIDLGGIEDWLGPVELGEYSGAKEH